MTKSPNALPLPILLLALAAVSVRAAEPLPADSEARQPELKAGVAATQAAQPKGYVYQPERVYTKDESDLIIRNDSVSGVAYALANVAGKEVFVSVTVQNLTVPDIEIKGTRSIVAEEIIRKLESIPEVAVVKLGDSTLAIVKKEPAIMTTAEAKRLERVADEVRRRRAAREPAATTAVPQP